MPLKAGVWLADERTKRVGVLAHNASATRFVSSPVFQPGCTALTRGRVDQRARPAYFRAAFYLLFACITASCASKPTTLPPAPSLNRGLESAAIAGTQLKKRVRITFGWSLQDRDARFSGDGVTRIEAPHQARLDLFGPRGETYLMAALVDFDLRLPPGAMGSQLLPPPTLLWSVLGVFRPPQNAELVATSGDSTQTELQYRAGEERWSFSLRGGRLQRAEWTGPSQGRQTVEIREYDSSGVPSRVVYRDWPAFRELSLNLTQTYDVAESFPPEIWRPGVR